MSGRDKEIVINDWKTTEILRNEWETSGNGEK